MAAKELGQRMDHDVRAMLDRADQIRRGERVIDDQRNAGLAGHGGDRGDIEDHAAGIGDGFDEDRLGFRRQRLFEAGGIVILGPDDIQPNFL